jgi:hypothetical protein
MDPDRLAAAVDALLAGQSRPAQIPELWDGKASERIVSILASTYR